MKKGFSLAEALITLMIVSLILAAVIPVMSKKQNTVDSMWRYSSNNADIYFGNNTSQSAVIGDSSVPAASKGSKLVIITPEDKDGDTIQRSLIDFYQKTPNGLNNIGRIAFDRNDNGTVAIGWEALISNTTGIANTAIGAQSLKNNETGYANTALGQEALRDNTVGARNTAVGDNALLKNIKANCSTAIGSDSLFTNTSGEANSALGFASLGTNKDGHWNTAVGTQSLYYNDANFNTAVGGHSMYFNTTGTHNVGIGLRALGGYREDNVDPQTGSLNTAIGTHALNYNTSGSQNVSIGHMSMFRNKTGNYNVAAGSGALGNIKSAEWNSAFGINALNMNNGGGNTAVGSHSIVANEDGNWNVGVGINTLSSLKNGDHNVALGASSCQSIKSGGGNLCLGAYAGPTEENVNSRLYIDYGQRGDSSLITGDFGYRWVKINGTLTTTSTLYTPTGTVSTSDKRLKNIVGDYNLGLEKILKLNIKEYQFKNSSKGGYDKRKHAGVIAQELQKIIPNSVIEGPGNDKYKTLLYVDQSEILFTSVNAIKQLYTKIINLNNRISSIEKENEKLKLKLCMLEKVNNKQQQQINFLIEENRKSKNKTRN